MIVGQVLHYAKNGMNFYHKTELNGSMEAIIWNKQINKINNQVAQRISNKVLNLTAGYLFANDRDQNIINIRHYVIC